METTNHVFNFPLGTIILMSTFGQEAIGAIYDLRWMLVTLFILMLFDTAFSYAEHIKDLHEGKKDDDWSCSGAIRRFGGKMGTYLSFLIIGCLVGLSFTEPFGYVNHIVTSAIGAGIGILCDTISIAGHWLHLKGIYITLSPTRIVRSLIIAYVKSKNDYVGEVVEEELNIEHRKHDHHNRPTRHHNASRKA